MRLTKKNRKYPLLVEQYKYLVKVRCSILGFYLNENVEQQKTKSGNSDKYVLGFQFYSIFVKYHFE